MLDELDLYQKTMCIGRHITTIRDMLVDIQRTKREDTIYERSCLASNCMFAMLDELEKSVKKYYDEELFKEEELKELARLKEKYENNPMPISEKRLIDLSEDEMKKICIKHLETLSDGRTIHSCGHCILQIDYHNCLLDLKHRGMLDIKVEQKEKELKEYYENLDALSRGDVKWLK